MKLSKTKLCKLIESCVRKQFLNESNIDELDVLHASPNKFDRFNHKKYLGKGTGTQSFGWGSYFSTNKDVIDGYLNRFSQTLAKTNSAVLNIMSKSLNRTDLQTYSEIYGPIWNYQFSSKEKLMSHLRGAYDDTVELSVALPMCIVGHAKNNPLLKSLLEKHGMSIIKNGWFPELYFKNKPCSHKDIQNNPELNHAYTAFANECLHIFKRWMDITEQVISEDVLHNKSFVAHKYNVSIPDESNGNYLEWYEPLQNSQIEQMKNGLRKIEQRFPKYKQLLEVERILNSKMQSESFETIYHWLKNTLGSQKAASMFLQYCGFDGIKYPPYTHWQSPDGASKDGMNYVVFDQNKAKINNVEGY